MLHQIEKFLKTHNICISNSTTPEQVPQVTDPEGTFYKNSERLKAVNYFRTKLYRGQLPRVLT